MILEPKTLQLNEYNSDSFITEQQLVKVLDVADKYRDELIELFKVDGATKVIKIGNASQLLKSIRELDDQCEKINVTSKVKDVYLYKMLEEEKALFEIFHIEDEFILKKNKSDTLIVETKYSAKSDLLDYYKLSKFANYCRDNEYDDLIDNIKDYLRSKSVNNEDETRLKIIYHKADNIFYLRAITSIEGYKEYGINFSVFVAIMALQKYTEKNESEIYIDNYSVDDSTLYVSFTLNSYSKVDNKLSLSINLVLENDEIKRSSVSFNGLVKLMYSEGDKKSEIYLRPKGLKKEEGANPVDLLTYAHRGSVQNVFERIEYLPKFIDLFISQVKTDSKKISSFDNPDKIRDFIAQKVKNARKEEFKIYKDKIYKMLTQINVDSTFMLFGLLREVDDLFETKDIVSKDYWRGKLYDAMIEGV